MVQKHDMTGDYQKTIYDAVELKEAWNDQIVAN